jgi:putative aldouronate transport system substrate-binding protein
MKRITQLLLIVMLISLTFSSCGTTPSVTPTTAAAVTESAATAGSSTTEAATTAESTTAEPVAASGPVSIEIMTQPWVGTPMGENDPYKKWLDENFNATFTLTQSPEFATEILVRFASGSPPDIFDISKDGLTKLYDQGVVVSDWSPYLDRMPTAARNIGDAAKSYYTRNNKLICLPALPGEQKWAFNIRTDWLKALGLSQPKTPDDLLAIAKAFTTGDPDKNGKSDTFAFTSAGAGKSLGEIANLLAMYGPMDFYVAEDGTVKHPVLDGNELNFLKFLKKIVDEKLIDPNWYTQGWNERKPNLYNGMFGINWYPPMALLTETDVSRNNDGVVLNWYETMSMPQGSSIGGKLPPMNPFGVLRTCSTNAEKDAAKWNVIMKFFEETSSPNEGYYKLRWGVGIDGFTMIPLEGGYSYIDLLGAAGLHKRGEREGQSLGLYDWGKIVVTYDDKIMSGSTEKPNDLVFKTVAMEQVINNIGRLPQDAFLLDLNPDVLNEANRIKSEFEINYILGKATDYEAFKEAWLAGGGQTLLNAANDQFKAKGMIK